MSFEYLDHKADIGIRVRADSVEELCREAAVAVFHLMYDPALVKSEHSFKVEVKACALDFLIVDFLNELLSIMGRYEVFLSSVSDVSVSVCNGEHIMSGEAWGEHQNRKKHHPKIEVKAATYSGLFCTVHKNQHVFTCLLDV